MSFWQEDCGVNWQSSVEAIPSILIPVAVSCTVQVPDYCSSKAITSRRAMRHFLAWQTSTALAIAATTAAAPPLTPAAARQIVTRHAAAGSSDGQQQQEQQQVPWQLGNYYTKKLSRSTDALGNIVQVNMSTRERYVCMCCG